MTRMLSGDLTKGELVELLRRGLRGLEERHLSRDQFADQANEAVVGATVTPVQMKGWLEGVAGFGNALAAVVMLARLGQADLLEMVAEAAGYGLVRREGAVGQGAGVDAPMAAAEALGTESDVVRAFLGALEDGRVTAEEMGSLVAAVRRDHAANELLVEIAKRYAV